MSCQGRKGSLELGKKEPKIFTRDTQLRIDSSKTRTLHVQKSLINNN